MFVRDFPDHAERLDVALRMMRDANIAFAIGTLSEQDRGRLIEILSFALPPPDAFAEANEHAHDGT